MSNKEHELIRPFRKNEPGQCPECGAALLVHDFQSETLQLNKFGEPIKTFNSTQRCVGKCPKCGTEIAMMLLGFKYRPVSDSMLFNLSKAFADISKQYESEIDDCDNPFMSSDE